MKWVRRFHMYLGLLLMPWVFFYGVSGALFNHPDIGRDIPRQKIAPERVIALTGFAPVVAKDAADTLVARMNARDSARVRIDASHPAEVWGWPLFSAPAAEGNRYTMIANLKTGMVGVGQMTAPEATPTPPFDATPLALPQYQTGTFAKQFEPLLATLHADTSGPLAPHPKVAPEIRFRVIDGDNRTWNVAWNMTTGALTTQPTDANGPRFVELLGTLHKTHHFPIHPGISFAWALMADLTGIALALWALSGLVMWWQIKPSRVLGVVAISAAMVVAGLVMTRMANEATFNPPAQQGP